MDKRYTVKAAMFEAITEFVRRNSGKNPDDILCKDTPDGISVRQGFVIYTDVGNADYMMLQATTTPVDGWVLPDLATFLGMDYNSCSVREYSRAQFLIRMGTGDRDTLETAEAMGTKVLTLLAACDAVRDIIVSMLELGSGQEAVTTLLINDSCSELQDDIYRVRRSLI